MTRILLSGSPGNRAKLQTVARRLGSETGTAIEIMSGTTRSALSDLVVYVAGKKLEAQAVLKNFRRIRAGGAGVIYITYRKLALPEAVRFGRLVEKNLPSTPIVFNEADLKRLLRQARTGIATNLVPVTGHALKELRLSLDLGQSELAESTGVTQRTIQNWEARKPPKKAWRALADFFELRRVLSRYVASEKIGQWLRTGNSRFGGKAPLELLKEGRIRDILVEFGRLRSGEPL